MELHVSLQNKLFAYSSSPASENNILDKNNKHTLCWQYHKENLEKHRLVRNESKKKSEY